MQELWYPGLNSKGGEMRSFSNYEKTLWLSSENLQEIQESSLKNWKIAIQVLQSEPTSNDRILFAATGRLWQRNKWREACIAVGREQLWLSYTSGETSSANVLGMTLDPIPEVYISDSEDPDVAVMEFPETGLGALAIRQSDFERMTALIGFVDSRESARETWIQEILVHLRTAEQRGTPSYLYRIEHIPSSYSISGTTVGNSPSALQIMKLGAMGWEIAGTFPHTIGFSSASSSSVSVLDGGGLGGFVDGAYVLLRLKVEGFELDDETPIVEVLREIWDSEMRRRNVEATDSPPEIGKQPPVGGATVREQSPQVGFFGMGIFTDGSE